MSSATLDRILSEHGIPSHDRPGFRALVFDGTRPNPGLLRRLHHVGNYAAALESILIELSKQVKHRFPPPGYKASSPRRRAS